MTTPTAPTASYVIAFRGDPAGDPDRHREANLTAVINRVARLDGLQIVVVDASTTPDWRPPDQFAGRVRVEHLPQAGAFNKAALMNSGFRLTDTPRLAFGDADVLVDGPCLTTALAALSDFAAVNLFDRLWEPDLATTQHLRAAAATQTPAPPPQDLPAARRGDEVIPFCGGLFAITAAAFAAVGGYDEQFRGWGGEDDALSIKLTRAGVRCGAMTEVVATHLWHPRNDHRYEGAQYQANVARLRWWASCPDPEFSAGCAADRQRLESAARFR